MSRTNRIDLHCHSTASDGSYSPSELVDYAAETGLRAIALTDHDTMEGLEEALARSEAAGLEVVPGVEISAEFKPGTMHILGYFVSLEKSGLAGKLKELQEGRRNRNPKIVSRLNELGFDITMEEIVEASGGGQVGRPHFARVMMNKGYVASVSEAFDKYLAKGKPAYEDKFRFSPEEAVSIIRKAGGVAVLAHPFTLKLERPTLESVVAGLKESGLAGLEVYYSEHTPQMIQEFKDLAGKYDLAPTGGSDFHGRNKPEIKLGLGFGNLNIGYELLEGLKRKREAAL